MKSEYTRKKKFNSLKINDKVIVRSNGNDPLIIGNIIRFEDFNNPRNKDFPVVKCEKTKKDYVCFGIVKPYSEDLLKKLSRIKPREQWNYLLKNCKI